MSSAVVSTSAALGRPFVFDEETEVPLSTPKLMWGQPPKPTLSEVEELALSLSKGAVRSSNARRPDVFQSAIKNQQSKISLAGVAPASRLQIRPAPEMVSSGIPALDALTGGLPRGCLTEICGPASSGRTTVLLATLAAATRRGEFCAVVDATDALDPHSTAAAGVELDRLLWVRCGEVSTQKDLSPRRHRGTEKNFLEVNRRSEDRNESRSTKHQTEHRLEQVLRATDLLLESGGFGLIVLDLADLPPQIARYIPLTTWFRFRRAIEHTPTMLLAIEQQPIAGSCSSLLLRLGAPEDALNEVEPAHAQLLTGLDITAELIGSRLIGSSLIGSGLDRKPVRSTAFSSRTAWTGRSSCQLPVPSSQKKETGS